MRSGILTSDAVNTLTYPQEVFYRRLMSIVDDFGRYDGRIKILKAALYPLRLDQVRDADLLSWIRATEEAGLVRVYTVQDKDYVQIEKFDQRLRAKHSKWPEPPTNADARGHPLSLADKRCQMQGYTEAESETKSNTEAGSDAITHDPPVELPDGFPRTAPEGIAMCIGIGATDAFIETEWHLAVSRGGLDSRQVPIRRFKSYIASRLSYSRSREAERQFNGIAPKLTGKPKALTETQIRFGD